MTSIEPTTKPPARTWRFGPPTRPYIIGPVTAVQMIMALGWVVLVYALLLLNGFQASLIPIMAATAVCSLIMFGRVNGRSVDTWIPPMVSWVGTVGRRRRRWTDNDKPKAPIAAAGWATPLGVTFTSRTDPDAAPENVGVFFNSADKAWVVVCRVTGDGFHLEDRPTKETALNQWGAALTALAEHGSPVNRAQWLERITRADSLADEAWDYYAERATPGAAANDYRELLDGLNGAMVHEIFVALEITPDSAGRAIKEAKQNPKDSDTAGAVFVLRDQATRLAALMEGFAVETLTQADLTRLIRTQWDPFCNDPDGPAWPTATKESMSDYSANGAVHITSWVSSLPTEATAPDFLGNLLLNPQLATPRTVSAVVSFVDPALASRKIERRQNARDGSRRFMESKGMRSSARDARRGDALDQTEVELAANYAHARFSLFVTVSAPNQDQARTEQRSAETAAEAARCKLQVLYGEQARAFVGAALPTARARS